MSFSASRLTIFALLTGLEEDLRELIVQHLGSHNAQDSLGERLFHLAMERFVKENQILLGPPLVSELAYFIDFADTYQVLNRHAQELPECLRLFLSKYTQLMDKLVAVRNRVAHVRPLQFDDLANVHDICDVLVSDMSLPWPMLKTTLLKIKEDPSFVLALRIPDSHMDEHNKHN